MDRRNFLLCSAALAAFPTLAAPAKLGAQLVQHSGKRWLVLDTQSVVLGRGRGSDVRFVAPGLKRVSRAHLRIGRVANRWQLTDLGTCNGTRMGMPPRPIVKGRSIALTSGQVVHVAGAMTFVVQAEGGFVGLHPKEGTTVGFVLRPNGAVMDPAMARLVTGAAAATRVQVVPNLGELITRLGPSEEDAHTFCGTPEY
jgi:hypothetical protein